jgi:hypothetical protein
MLDLALESPSLNIGFRPELNYEGRSVLPSMHPEGRIVRVLI